MGALQTALHGTAISQSPSGGTSDWYLDTGASSHMSSGAGNLHSLRPSHSSSQIVVGNGAHLPITYTGTGSLITSTSSLTLRNVLLSFVNFVEITQFQLNLMRLVSLSRTFEHGQ
jgi:hypothetical protein